MKQSGLQLINDPETFTTTVLFVINKYEKTSENKFKSLNPAKEYTRLEQMMISSLHDCIFKLQGFRN